MCVCVCEREREREGERGREREGEGETANTKMKYSTQESNDYGVAIVFKPSDIQSLSGITLSL